MTDVIINWWAVIVAMVSAMFIGTLWYSKFMFMNAWLSSLGTTQEEMKAKGGSAGKAMGGMLVLAFLQAYIISHFVSYLAVTTAWGAVQLGIWLWLGFAVPVLGAMSLFEMRRWKLFWISAGNQIITIIAMSSIIALWK